MAAMNSCPFCKGEVRLSYNDSDGMASSLPAEVFHFTCGECGAEIVFIATDKNDAIRKWNTRGEIPSSGCVYLGCGEKEECFNLYGEMRNLNEQEAE